MQLDPAAAHVLLDGDRHLLVQRREDLIGDLDDRDLGAAVPEVLRHLDPDVARADDDGADGAAGDLRLHDRGIQVRLDAVHVLHVAQDMDAGQVGPRQRELHRIGPGAQGEGVVGLGVLAAGLHVAHRHGPRDGIERDNFAVDPHVEIERLAQALRCLQQQTTAIGDDAADVVREAAVRERHVVAPLQHDDLRRFVQTPRPRSDRCSPGDSADDDELHDFLPVWSDHTNIPLAVSKRK